MTIRIAGTMSLIAFAVCLVAGIGADNPLSTSIGRALVAMFGTLCVGAVVGWMAQKMLNEHVRLQREKFQNSQPNPRPNDR